MRIAIYLAILALVVLLAFWRGQRDERLAALTCLAGTLLTVAVNSSTSVRHTSFEMAAFLVDLAILLVFVLLALRSERFWPLWVAGLQLTATTVHLLKLLHPDLMPFVMGAALAFWSYPILLLIAAGALRTRTIAGWRSLAHLRQAA